MDSTVFLVVGVLIAAFVLWEFTLEWRVRRNAHYERVRRDAEADRLLKK